MKKLTEPYVFRGENAWGRTSVSTRQAFEVEKSDVGKPEPNYLGYNHRTYTFTHADVGRKIERIAPPQPCWAFTSDEWIAKYLAASPKTLYDDVKASGGYISNHESDLYIEDTLENRAILDRHPIWKKNASRFQNRVTGKPCIEIPFAYLPWWEARKKG